MFEALRLVIPQMLLGMFEVGRRILILLLFDSPDEFFGRHWGYLPVFRGGFMRLLNV